MERIESDWKIRHWRISSKDIGQKRYCSQRLFQYPIFCDLIFHLFLFKQNPSSIEEIVPFNWQLAKKKKRYRTMWMLLIGIIYSIKENFLLKNLLYIRLTIRIRIKISYARNDNREFRKWKENLLIRNYRRKCKFLRSSF